MISNNDMKLSEIYITNVEYKHIGNYKLPVPYMKGHMYFYDKSEPVYFGRCKIVGYGVIRNIEINLN